MHEVLFNRLGGLSLPRKSVVRLTDRPDMTLDVYRGRKTTIQQQQLTHTLQTNIRSPLHLTYMYRWDVTPEFTLSLDMFFEPILIVLVSIPIKMLNMAENKTPVAIRKAE